MTTTMDPMSCWRSSSESSSSSRTSSRTSDQSEVENTRATWETSSESKTPSIKQRAGDSSSESAYGATGLVWPWSSSESSMSSSTSSYDQIQVENTREEFEAKYQEQDKLEDGGFGSVYAGVRRSDGLQVAIKYVEKDVGMICWESVYIDGEELVFPTEVLLMQKATGGLNSDGKSAVVTLYDWYSLEREIVLVMERPLPCVDLYTHLLHKDEPLEEEEVKDIMKQLVEAAIHMQCQGVFHRDIKSENVLVETGPDGPRVRIIDFGCGAFVNEINNGVFYDAVGTPQYNPPEFFTKGVYEAGSTTVWQLGVLLYEMLDYRSCFSTKVFLENKLIFMCKLDELKVSQDCLAFMKTCLAAEPEMRMTLEQMQQHPWLT